MSIEIGREAPAFSLPDDTGRHRSLGDLAGQWVVLYFYPKADTPGCTTQACEFTESIDDFAGMEATVIGVSPDKPEKLAKFRAKHGLKVTLLGDPEKQTLRDYGAWGKKTMYGKVGEGVIRSTVLVDPDGRVAHHWPKAKAKGHAAEVAEKLGELRNLGKA